MQTLKIKVLENHRVYSLTERNLIEECSGCCPERELIFSQHLLWSKNSNLIIIVITLANNTK